MSKGVKHEYKILNIKHFEPRLIESDIARDTYFMSNGKKQVITNMVEHYFSPKNRFIYMRTDYICNKKEKIWLCNTRADDLRRSYDGINYKPREFYISWFEETKETI